MNSLTLKSARELLAPHIVEIRPYRSASKFAGANYLVRVKTGCAQTMSDGTDWDGYEHVGHYRFAADAIAAAVDTAKERNGGDL